MALTTLRPWSLYRSLRKRAQTLLHPARTGAHDRATIGTPYDEIDDEFHDAYAAARIDVEQDVPVFIVLADDLVFLHAGTRESASFSPPGYHLIKMVSHAPLAIFVSLQGEHAAKRAQDAMGRRESLRGWIDEARARLSRADGVTADARADLEQVLQTCAAYLRSGAVDPHAGRELARAVSAPLLRLIDAATLLQLNALHAHVEASLAKLTAEQRARLEVVVTGNHQARVRSMPMQYFQRRVGERVVYGEGVASEQEALALIGVRALDAAIGEAFFADRKRMQRDLLGDSAQAHLANFDLKTI